MQIFAFAVLLNEKRDKDNEVVQEAEIVVPVTQVLARDGARRRCWPLARSRMRW